MRCLIVTHSDDELATLPVIDALRARGAEVWVLPTDRVPLEVGLSWTGPGEGWFSLPQGRLHLQDIDAIWFRRDRIGSRLPQDLPADVRRAAASETRGVLRGMLLDTDAFLLDPPAVYARARHKALQLKLAREVGLAVPRTLESSDPVEARAFVASVGGPVVAKLHTDVRLAEGTVYTNVLGPDDLEALDELAACPMILQEAVPKARELRVVCAGRRLFALALETSELDAASQQDWRRSGEGTLDRWRPYELPADVARAFGAFYDRLDANYASADMVVTPDGRHVLLESNAVGESFWFYDHHPLADALADVLCDLAPRRANPQVLR